MKEKEENNKKEKTGMKKWEKILIICDIIVLVLFFTIIGVKLVIYQINMPEPEPEPMRLEVDTFNCMFEDYECNKAKGSTVKMLINEIIVNNANEKGRIVSLNGMTETEEIQEFSMKIDTNKKYKVNFKYDQEGFINKAIVTEID